MEKERFNEIIDLIIENISKRVGICSVLRSLNYNLVIDEDEYYEMKCRLDEIFYRMIDDGKQTYDEEGHPSENFTYLFPNNKKRCIFLQNLKFKTK